MAQIIYPQPPQEGLASKIGTGLSNALNALAENKMASLQRQQTQQRGASGLQALGFAPQEAFSVAGLDPAIQREIVKQKLLAPGNEAYLQALQGILGGQEVQQQQSSAENVPEQIAGNQGVMPSIAGTKGINQQQATKLAELALKKKQNETRETGAEKRHTEKLHVPYIAKLEERGQQAISLRNIAQEALDLLKTGKVITGLKGRLTPADLQTEEGQKFLSKINGIVLLKAQLGRGVPSKLRLAMEKLSKPDVWQKPRTIEGLLNDIISEPITRQDAAKYNAYQELLEKYPNEVPKNLRQQVHSRSNEIIKEEQSGKLNSLSNSSALKYNGQIVDNPTTGQSAKSINGKWVIGHEDENGEWIPEGE